MVAPFFRRRPRLSPGPPPLPLLRVLSFFRRLGRVHQFSPWGRLLPPPVEDAGLLARSRKGLFLPLLWAPDEIFPW